MAKLTGELRVGIVRFHEGVDLGVVQEAIDRLYEKYRESSNDNGRLERMINKITKDNLHPET